MCASAPFFALPTGVLAPETITASRIPFPPYLLNSLMVFPSRAYVACAFASLVPSLNLGKLLSLNQVSIVHLLLFRLGLYHQQLRRLISYQFPYHNPKYSLITASLVPQVKESHIPFLP